MKLRFLFPAACVVFVTLLVSPILATARDAYYKTYSQMTQEADFIVIAQAKSNTDIGKPFNYLNTDVIGVETVFSVVAVLKDNSPQPPAQQTAPQDPKTEQTFVLYHYRLANPEQPIVDGPALVSFDPNDKGQYLMFLRRTEENRYEPLTTQYDAEFSIEKLRFAADN